MKYAFSDEVDAVLIADDDDAHVYAPCAHFARPVVIARCRIRQLQFLAAQFEAGLRLFECMVECPAIFQSGGHNRRPVEFQDVVFLDSVDFEDCWFEADVVLRRVRFAKGTNILGNKGTPMEVTFDGELVLEDVEGALDVDTFEAPRGAGPGTA